MVRAPSRLHFGMFSFGVPTLRQFGGAGVMIDEPALELRISAAEKDEFLGPNQQRLRQAVVQVRATSWGRDLPPLKVETIVSPRSHTGLGSGTQTALAVVAGLRKFLNLPPLGALELAQVAGRAKRSAVGLYGFLHGGLIVEAGRLPHDGVAPLAAQVELPETWRFVLICPREQQGLSGEPERAAFADLPAVPQSLTDQLCRIALLDLVPAARSGDFAGFSEALYHFGHAAGQCFKSHQAGVYATDELAMLVARVRALGVAGVGQSSWGPTLFTVHPSVLAAEQFIASCQAWPDAARYDVTVAAPNRGGASFHSIE
ncbi:MAG: beta-RFAP synthase [Pirellula sp.]|nr:beta-RFAP synthase [Pirellula sp.]